MQLALVSRFKKAVHMDGVVNSFLRVGLVLLESNLMREEVVRLDWTYSLVLIDLLLPLP